MSLTPWRNGSASDSRPEGWGFESLWGHYDFFVVRSQAEKTKTRTLWSLSSLYVLFSWVRLVQVNLWTFLFSVLIFLLAAKTKK